MLTTNDYQPHELLEMSAADLQLASDIHQEALASWNIDDRLKLSRNTAKRFKTTMKRLCNIFPQDLYITVTDPDGTDHVYIRIVREPQTV
jgi:hypothetical protein